MFDRYTERGSPAHLFLARHEALRLGSPPIEPEHLLVGMTRSSNQRAGELLATRHARGLAAGNRDPKRPIAVEALRGILQERRSVPSTTLVRRGVRLAAVSETLG